MTFPLEAFQTSQRFQVPSWSVYLSIHWFSQVHSEILVSGGAPKILELEQEASATGSAVVAALARRLLLSQQPMLSPARAT